MAISVLVVSKQHKYNEMNQFILLYTTKIQNSARVDMPTDLHMLLCDVPYLTLLMQRRGKKTNYLLQQLFYA